MGLVAPLFEPAAMGAGDWGQIEANAHKVITNVKAVGPFKRH